MKSQGISFQTKSGHPVKEKKAEMSFLRVSDLLLVCVVLNHDADSPLYH